MRAPERRFTFGATAKCLPCPEKSWKPKPHVCKRNNARKAVRWRVQDAQDGTVFQAHRTPKERRFVWPNVNSLCELTGLQGRKRETHWLFIFQQPQMTNTSHSTN